MWIALSVVAGVIAVIGIIIGLNMMVANMSTAPEPEASSEPEPQDVITDAVPRVTELVGTRSGTSVTFTWENPSPEEGDSYIWQLVDLSGSAEAATIPDPTVTIEASAGQTCLDVILRRGDGRSSEPVRGCVDQ